MNSLNKIYKKINKSIKLDDNISMRLLKNTKHSSDILKMRNDPLNIRFSLTKKKIQVATHKTWIKKIFCKIKISYSDFQFKKKKLVT